MSLRGENKCEHYRARPDSGSFGRCINNWMLQALKKDVKVDDDFARREGYILKRHEEAITKQVRVFRSFYTIEN